MKISFSIDINSPPATVFGWVENPEKAVKWMTSVAKTEVLHETPERIGTTFREVVEEGGSGMELQGAITDYKPNKSISFHLESRVNVVDVMYYVEELPNGTRLSQNANVRWKFPVNVISIFMGSKIKKNISTQSQKEFEKLKELCENDSRNKKYEA
jgi:uncharacterized protein YndB with AHSA1/START domain